MSDRSKKKMPGLLFDKGVWRLDKRIKGQRLCASSSYSEGQYQQAEAWALDEIESFKGRIETRPDLLWRDAATQYLNTVKKRSLADDARALEKLDPYIGDLPLPEVCMETLQPYIDDKIDEGYAVGTINRDLAVARRILNLCARLWRHDKRTPWLQTAPLIVQLKDRNKRPAYPLHFDEQRLLFSQLHEDLHEACLFKVNTGCREQEVVGLQWAWEIPVPELEASVFLIPPEWDPDAKRGGHVKNDMPRLVVLNRIAKSIVERRRGQHPTHVFSHLPGKDADRQPFTRLNNTGWRGARRRAAKVYQETLGRPMPAGFERVRLHDLKHTFGTRLRAAGVSFEDRQDLLGHKSQRVTTDYSAAQVGNLIKCANRVALADGASRKNPETTILRVVKSA